VAPVTGDPAAAQIRWATAATAVDLRRTKPNELTGTFRRTDIAAGRADTIVFRQAAEPRPQAGTGGEIGQRFPDFPMVTMEGRTVRLSDFRGKTVVVNFFQPWCVWCIEEFAVWRASVPRYGDKLVILPVVYGVTDGEWLRTSARAKRYGVPVYGVDKAPVSFKGIPSSWVVGKDGIIVDKMRYQAAHLMFERLDKATK
jgi:thiol-disulfide isomerase/thioredoxin